MMSLFLHENQAALSAEYQNYAFAACVELDEKVNKIQILPDGNFRAVDGRPYGLESWVLNAASAAMILEDAADKKNDFLIDYEHQSLHAEYNGQPAIAAGWFKKLEYVEGVGLFAADVVWTEKARAYIQSKEYRYLSPVFKYDDKGRVTSLVSCAITNTPALDQLPEVTALRKNKEVENNVNLKAIALKLALKEDATEDQILKAIGEKDNQIAALNHEKTTLSQDLEKKKQAVEAQTAALKQAEAGQIDLSKFVPISTLEATQAQLTKLQKEIKINELDAVITQGLESGALLPAHEEWARQAGEQNLVFLKSFIEKQAPISALTQMQTQKDNTPPPKDPQKSTLTEQQVAVCKEVGLTQEEYLAQLKALKGEKA